MELYICLSCGECGFQSDLVERHWYKLRSADRSFKQWFCSDSCVGYWFKPEHTYEWHVERIAIVAEFLRRIKSTVIPDSTTGGASESESEG